MRTLKLLAGLFAGMIGIAGGLALALYLYGLSLPETHRETLTTDVAAPRERVWAAITGYAETPRWWNEIASVSEETRADGTRVTWNTDSHGQKVGFVTTEETRGTRLTRRILDTGLPYGGSWTFELSDVPNGPGGRTQVILTEDGFIRQPFFRAVTRLFVGQRATMGSYLAALKKRVE